MAKSLTALAQLKKSLGKSFTFTKAAPGAYEVWRGDVYYGLFSRCSTTEQWAWGHNMIPAKGSADYSYASPKDILAADHCG